MSELRQPWAIPTIISQESQWTYHNLFLVTILEDLKGIALNVSRLGLSGIVEE